MVTRLFEVGVEKMFYYYGRMHCPACLDTCADKSWYYTVTDFLNLSLHWYVLFSTTLEKIHFYKVYFIESNRVIFTKI